MSARKLLRTVIFPLVILEVLFLQRASSQKCQFGFQELDNECYYFSYPITANFIGAQEYCESVGATLAIIDTKEKAAAITPIVQEYATSIRFFIGGYNVGHKDRYIWNGLGTPFSYANWYTTSSSSEYCVVTSSYWGGEWYFVNCDTEYAFICQQLNETCYDSTEATSCSGSYSLVNGKCYSFVTERNLPWLQAKEYCERRGDILAILDSEVANEGVKQLLTGANLVTNDFWIGAYDKSHESTWVWDGKGTELTYTNWFDGVQPANSSTANCAVLSDNAWENRNCTQESNFICQELPESCGVATIPDIVLCPGSPIDGSTSAPIVTTNTPDCNYPFVLLGSGCFLVQRHNNSQILHTWEEAVSACERLGATIGYILNEEENNALMRYMPGKQFLNLMNRSIERASSLRNLCRYYNISDNGRFVLCDLEYK